jgi:GT2 family glycosyltransferase
MTTAIIPNWNGAALLERYLPSLFAQSLPFARILIVDNGSADDSIAIAERLGAEVLRLDRNQGFAPAVNQGARAAKTDFIAVINNDVRLDRDWHARLAQTGAAISAGKILQERHPDLIDGTFDSISRGACSWRCGADRPDGPLWNERRTVTLLPITAVLVRRSVWEAVGGLDERFESYLEDVDFGIRAASAGYTGVYEPTALGWHLGSATRGAWHPQTVRQISRNQLYLVAKHFSARALVRFGWPIAAGQAGWGLLALRHRAGMAYLSGKLEGILGFSPMRRNATFAPDEYFRAAEKELLNLQRKSGFDRYWRTYAALTGA